MVVVLTLFGLLIISDLLLELTALSAKVLQLSRPWPPILGMSDKRPAMQIAVLILFGLLVSDLLLKPTASS